MQSWYHNSYTDSDMAFTHEILVIIEISSFKYCFYYWYDYKMIITFWFHFVESLIQQQANLTMSMLRQGELAGIHSMNFELKVVNWNISTGSGG